MEEVDKIIFQNLNSLGWESEETPIDLKSLDIGEIARGISKCLLSINDGADIPLSLPHNMAQRFRAAASLAVAIKDLGYVGDVGYQTILYPSEHDLRKIFMFLIEKLPKDSASLRKEPLGRKENLLKNARKKVDKALRRPWVPSHCMQMARRTQRYTNTATTEDIPVVQNGILHCSSFNSSSHFMLAHFLKGFSETNKILHSLFSQVAIKSCYPSIVNTHSLLQIESSLSNPKVDIQDAPSEYFGQQKPSLSLLPLSGHLLKYLNAQRNLRSGPISSFQPLLVNDETHSFANEELVNEKLKLLNKRDGVQKQIQELSSNLQDLNASLEKCHQLVSQKEKVIKEFDEKFAYEEKALDNFKKASLLASNPLDSINKLKSNLLASEKKEEKLSCQWDEYKKELENHLQELTLACSQQKSKKQEILQNVTKIRDQMKKLGADAVKKQSFLVQLKQEYESQPKGVNRSAYTKRILDISGKVRKQKAEIEKVIVDIKSVQKEINTLTGKLQRTFAVVEDASYKAASSNEKARPIYRTIITIHETCGELLDTIRDTGIIQREVAEFKVQLEAEKNKKVEETLHQLQSDLERISKENALLKKKLSSS